MRTFFNLLGPLTNPAGQARSLPERLRERAGELIAGALAALGLQRGFVVHGSDGLDEITTTGPTLVLKSGSVAYDGVETPHGKVDRMLGGAATYIALAASYFTPVKLVAVVGDDFAAGGWRRCWPPARSISPASNASPGGKTFFWAGVYSADMNDRTTLRTDLNVFADFNPKLPESYRGAVPLPRQHPARPAAQRARADERRQAHRRRHHELLDQRFSRRAARNHRSGTSC
jgi:hypothetical protein